MLTNQWRARNLAVATVIQASRRSAGLTQRQLVNRLPGWLKWDQTILAKVETNHRRLDLIELMELATALEITVQTLVKRIVDWHESSG